MLTVKEIREFHRKVDEGEIECPGTRVEQVYHYSVGKLLGLIERAIASDDGGNSAKDMREILKGKVND